MPSAALQLTLTVFSKWIGFWPELPKMGYSRKNANSVGGWGHGICRGIEERTCGLNYRGQLKKKKWCTRKSDVQEKIMWFPRLSGLGFRPWNFLGWSGKSKISRVVFSKLYPSPSCLDCSWNSPVLSILIAILMTWWHDGIIDDVRDDASDMLRFLLKY